VERIRTGKGLRTIHTSLDVYLFLFKDSELYEFPKMLYFEDLFTIEKLNIALKLLRTLLQS